MYCRKCGTPNPDDRSSCLQCNAPLSAPLPQRPGSQGIGTNQPAPPTTQTSAFQQQPSAPTIMMPPPQQTGPQSPTTGPISGPQPSTPPIYQPMQTTFSAPPAPVDYGAGPVVQAKMNSLALVSVISGSAGIVLCWACGIGFIPSIVGGITGFLGMKKVQLTGERGKELAIAGLVTGGVGFLLNLFWILDYGLAGINAIINNH